MDYRIDLKQFNRNQESIREPILKMDLVVEDLESEETRTKKTSLELSKDQLNEIVSDFDKINAQLTQLSGV